MARSKKPKMMAKPPKLIPVVPLPFKTKGARELSEDKRYLLLIDGDWALGQYEAREDEDYYAEEEDTEPVRESSSTWLITTTYATPPRRRRVSRTKIVHTFHICYPDGTNDTIELDEDCGVEAIYELHVGRARVDRSLF